MTTDMRRCKRYSSTEAYTYAQTEDYKQKEALGLLEEENNTPFEVDPALLDALIKDKRTRNIQH